MKQFALISSILDIFIPIFGHLKINNRDYELVNKLNFQEERTKIGQRSNSSENPIKKIFIEISS